MNKKLVILFGLILVAAMLIGAKSLDNVPSCGGYTCTIMCKHWPIGTNWPYCEGTSGNDVICGTERRNVIYGYGGNDKICGWYGNDTIYGGDQNDILSGGPGFDWIDGESGVDTCIDPGIGTIFVNCP